MKITKIIFLTFIIMNFANSTIVLADEESKSVEEAKAPVTEPVNKVSEKEKEQESSIVRSESEAPSENSEEEHVEVVEKTNREASEEEMPTPHD